MPAKAVLRGKMTLDATEANRAIAGVQQKVGAFASGQLRAVGGMIGGAFAVGAVIGFGKRVLQAADGLADLRAITGATAEQIQALQVATLEYGGTSEGVATALLRLQRSQGEAINGNKTYLDSFRRLNIAQADLERMGTGDLLEQIARAYAESNQSASAFADTNVLLGRAGKDLAEVLRVVGEEGLQTLIDKGKEAGTVLSDELISQLAATNNELELMQRQIEVGGSKALASTAQFFSAYSAGWKMIRDAIKGGPGAVDAALESGEYDTLRERAARDIEALDELKRRRAEATRMSGVQAARESYETAAGKAAFDRLSATEQIVALETKIATLRGEQAQYRETDIEYWQKGREAIAAEVDLERMRSKGERAKAGSAAAEAVGRLQRIGGYLGGAGAMVPSDVKEQTRLQQMIAEAAQRNAAASERAARVLEEG